MFLSWVPMPPDKWVPYHAYQETGVREEETGGETEKSLCSTPDLIPSHGVLKKLFRMLVLKKSEEKKNHMREAAGQDR